MPLKANNPYVWEIILGGKKATKGKYFTGTVDEALSEADVMECQVRFAVTSITLTRLERPKALRK